MSFDPSCQDLAKHFLADDIYTNGAEATHETRVTALAQAIQDAIETWLEMHPATDEVKADG